MNNYSSKIINNRVENLIKTFQSEIDKKPLFKTFIDICYNDTIHNDLLLKNDQELFTTISLFFSLIENKKQNEFKIKTKTIKDKGKEYSFVTILANDMPFLVDSFSAKIAKLGFATKRIVNRLVGSKRDKKGALEQLYSYNDSLNHDGLKNEAIISFQITLIKKTKIIKILEKSLTDIFLLVEKATRDWSNVLYKLYNIKKEIKSLNNVIDKRYDLEEDLQFCDWVEDNAFIFLGYTEYNSKRDNNNDVLFSIKNNSQLGICQNYKTDDLIKIEGKVYDKELKNSSLIDINKSGKKSPIHRDVHLDVIRIKKFDAKGKLIGEYRFFGLFTSILFFQKIDKIPLIRKKVSEIIKKSNFNLSGHNGKELVSAINNYPREELFQISEKELLNICLGIVSLSGRLIAKIFYRQDKFNRFTSVFCYLPRLKISSGVRDKIKELLEKELKAKVDVVYTQVTDAPLARFHMTLVPLDGMGSPIMPIDYCYLEENITKIISSWQDNLIAEMQERYKEEEVLSKYKRYKNAFPLSYTDDFSANIACLDIDVLEESLLNNHPIIKLFKNENDIFLKLYNKNEQIKLSSIMPILDNFAIDTIDEHIYKVKTNSSTIWIHYFKIILPKTIVKFDKVQPIFENAGEKCLLGEIENDELNKLILIAGVDIRDIALIRAYCKFIKQTNFSYGFDFIIDALSKNSKITNKLIQLFYGKFKPKSTLKIDEIKASIIKSLSKVKNVAEDVVISKFLELLNATVRTNFFQLDEEKQYKNYISFKILSKNISDIAFPKPEKEVFVYSANMEGVHLRAGDVARGGLRWSDRSEDFRTEVQGLVKAQITKNAVIIPTGSKGGFIVKKNLSDLTREEFMAEGIVAYKTFLSGILDITDNIKGDKVISPANVVRYDGDDPYLVVAADKGTATFSDIANELAKKYNFWLGDAFASGGSQGYDHKKMGITAKGAFVSVQRHFYEMNKNIEQEKWTAIGIGDMSGDVFGNGMLLSKTMKLVAAFNHIHIFIDPNPNEITSYKERKRLFALPRSSWDNYSQDLISEGGGIFSRKDKIIKLTDQIRELLNIEEKELSPNELIKSLLKSEVDLLWNGGIGTYVKSIAETNSEVGDRVNDNVRINAQDLRCKIVGEGGNLGFTQRGRIEYALNNGRINTDSVDNVAGVNCSDHEVNIKILLQNIIANKKISMSERNKLLEEMTEEVEKLVLRNNFLQTQAISIAKYQGVKSLEQQSHLMKTLEEQGLLDRKVEFLPSNEEISRRFADNKGLTRPELSVLFSYSKIYLYKSILASNLPDDEYFNIELKRYFPEKLYKKYSKFVKDHNLKREIITSYVTNSLANHLGLTFFNRLSESTGLHNVDIARAYIVARDSFQLRNLWQKIEDLTNIVDYGIQIKMFREISELVERSTAWFIRSFPTPITNITELVQEFKKKLEIIMNNFEEVLVPETKKVFFENLKFYKNKNVPDTVAKQVASIDLISTACQVVQISRGKKVDLMYIAKLYYSIAIKLHFRYIRKKARALKMLGYWDKLSVKSLADDLFDHQMRLTENILSYAKKNKKEKLSVDKLIADWSEYNNKDIKRWNSFISDLQTHENPTFAMLTISANRIKSVVSS